MHKGTAPSFTRHKRSADGHFFEVVTNTADPAVFKYDIQPDQARAVPAGSTRHHQPLGSKPGAGRGQRLVVRQLAAVGTDSPANAASPARTHARSRGRRCEEGLSAGSRRMPVRADRPPGAVEACGEFPRLLQRRQAAAQSSSFAQGHSSRSPPRSPGLRQHRARALGGAARSREVMARLSSAMAMLSRSLCPARAQGPPRRAAPRPPGRPRRGAAARGSWWRRHVA